MARHRPDDQPEPEKLPFEMSPGYWDLSELARLNMIQLKEALQQAALPAEEQIAKLEGTVVADEIALDFDNWCQWAFSGAECPVLTDEQRSGLLALNDQLDRMSDKGKAELWTDEALRNSPEWEEVRRKARDILKVFNWPEEE